MKILKTANYKLKRKLEEQKLRDFSTTIPLINDATNQLEDVEVEVAYSPKMDSNGWSINIVKDVITGEDLTDLVYDQSNREIMNKLLSEINDMTGNAEQDAYDQETYDVEMSRDTHKNYGDGYQASEDTSPCKDPNDQPRSNGKSRSYQRYPNVEKTNFYSTL